MVDSKSKVLANNISLKSIKLHNAKRDFEQPKKGLEFIIYFFVSILFLYVIYNLFSLSKLYDKMVAKLIEINTLWAFITLFSIFIFLCMIFYLSFLERSAAKRLGEQDWFPIPFFSIAVGFTPVVCNVTVFGHGFFEAIISFFLYFFTFAFLMMAVSVLLWLPFGIFLASKYIVGATFYISRKLNLYFIGESLTQDVNELNHNISPVMLPILNSMGGGTLGEIYNEVNKSLDFISIDVLDVLLRNHENVEVVKFDEYVCYKSKLVSGGSNMKTVILDDE